MDVVIYTADPESVDVEAIREAIESLNYYVADITVCERY